MHTSPRQEAPDDGPQHTAGRFLRSSGAAALSQGLRVLTTLAAQFLLRRWIPPEDWGLFQWSLVVFLVVGAVRDLGLGYHVLRVQPKPYGHLLALECVWGGVLLLAALLLAPLGPNLYAGSHEDTAGVLRVLALFLFFEGLATVPRTYLEGELQVGRAVAPELWRNLVFVLSACLLAYLGWGVWSLALGHTLATAVYAAVLWRRVWGEIPLHWHRGQMPNLLLHSAPLALIWFLAILIRHLDPLILGWRFPFDDVGQYGLAFDWALMASGQILLPAITRTLFPALVRLREQAGEMFRAYALSTLFVLCIEVPAALFLFLNADLVMRLVGGSQWTDAPTYLRILCFAPLVDPFNRFAGEVAKALHWDRLWIAASSLTVLSFGIGGIVLTGGLGPAGMAWAKLLPLGSLLMTWVLWLGWPKQARQLAAKLLWVYLLPLPFFALAWWAAAWLSGSWSGGAGMVSALPVGMDPAASGGAATQAAGSWLTVRPSNGLEELWRCLLSLLAGALSLLLLALRFGRDFLAFFRPGSAGARS